MKNNKSTIILLCCQILLCFFCFNIGKVFASDTFSKKPKETAIFRTINKAKDYIVKHQNKNGGWPLVPEGNSDVEITALAIWALTEAGWGTGSRVIRSGVRYLKNKQQNDGSWNNNTAHTAFALVALANAKADPDARLNGLIWLRNAQNPSGSWGRKNKSPGQVLYTSATVASFKKLGFKYTHFKRLKTGIEWIDSPEQRNFEKFWSLQNGTQSDIFVTSWALLGLLLDSDYDFEKQIALDKQIAWLKQFQNKDGGFPRYKGKPSDPEVTAAAIMALAASNDPLNTIRIATAYLTKAQEPDGSFVSNTPIELNKPVANLQSTCFALIAIFSKAESDR